MNLLAHLLFAPVAAGAKMPCASDFDTALEMPTVTPAGRNLLQIVWDELDLAQGDDKHLAMAAEEAMVGGVDYDTKCALAASCGSQNMLFSTPSGLCRVLIRNMRVLDHPRH